MGTKVGAGVEGPEHPFHPAPDPRGIGIGGQVQEHLVQPGHLAGGPQATPVEAVEQNFLPGGGFGTGALPQAFQLTQQSGGAGRAGHPAEGGTIFPVGSA